MNSADNFKSISFFKAQVLFFFFAHPRCRYLTSCIYNSFNFFNFVMFCLSSNCYFVYCSKPFFLYFYILPSASCKEPRCDLFRPIQSNPQLTSSFTRPLCWPSPVRWRHKRATDPATNTIRLWSWSPEEAALFTCLALFGLQDLCA